MCLLEPTEVQVLHLWVGELPSGAGSLQISWTEFSWQEPFEDLLALQGQFQSGRTRSSSRCEPHLLAVPVRCAVIGCRADVVSWTDQEKLS